MRILFAASEIYPYVKTGGLADVAEALPRALNKLGTDVVCVMPLYGFMDKSKLQNKKETFCVELGGIYYDISLYSAINGDVETIFVDAPILSNTMSLYAYSGTPYSNNDLRFGLFSAIVAELAKRECVDILHLNDWHCGLSALWIKEDPKCDIKVVFSIHNLAYQGLFEKDSMSRLGIDEKYFNRDELEFHSKLSFIKAGIRYSDALTTVSPKYAEEILSKRFGCGLEGFLNQYSEKLIGILNGIDTEIFNPKSDKALYFNYDADTLEAKGKNKRELLKKIPFKDDKKPLFVMVSRMVQQKGVDLVIRALPKILDMELNILFLGEGEMHYYDQINSFCEQNGNIEIISGYNEDLSRKVYASADFLLMPSLYEPCGLNQMIAARYGTIPIVHGVGGLYDSVHEEENRCIQGIVFKDAKVEDLLEAIERALDIDKKRYKEMQIFNMDCDLSFKESAELYDKLYVNLLKENNV